MVEWIPEKQQRRHTRSTSHPGNNRGSKDMQSLQQIAQAWGNWSAGTFKTKCKPVATTDFKDMPNDLKPYQCVGRIQKLEYDGASPPTDSSAIAHDQWYDNGTSRDQTITFSYETTTTRTFEWSIEATVA